VQASATAVQDTGPDTAYSRFRSAVAQAQFSQWLAELGQRATAAHLVDISGPGTDAAAMAAAAGHDVVRVFPPGLLPGKPGPAHIQPVTGDGGGLEFLADRCADGVIAEDRTLSRHLAAEDLVSEIARVLKPGGGVFACVDSLTLGMAVLAQQQNWPHLVDLPHADVVLVPWPDGAITRCYGAEHLRELFTSNGFDVSWIRPRTIFSPKTVGYLLDRDPGSFKRLVKAELAARADDSVGDQLIISARRRLSTRCALTPPPVALGLARHAASGRGARLQPLFRHRVTAVHAPPVAAVVDPGERGEHVRAQPERRLHRGEAAVGLRQVRASVSRLRGPVPVQRMLTAQHRDRAVQVVPYFF
jgi:SAM-dependent methyltransferase